MASSIKAQIATVNLGHVKIEFPLADAQRDLLFCPVQRISWTSSTESKSSSGRALVVFGSNGNACVAVDNLQSVPLLDYLKRCYQKDKIPFIALFSFLEMFSFGDNPFVTDDQVKAVDDWSVLEMKTHSPVDLSVSAKLEVLFSLSIAKENLLKCFSIPIPKPSSPLVPKNKPVHPNQRIYAIGDVDHGVFKIGIAENPLDRLAALQTAYPYQLAILFSTHQMSNASQTERQLHKKLADFRLKGEWFDMSAYSLVDWGSIR